MNKVYFLNTDNFLELGTRTADGSGSEGREEGRKERVALLYFTRRHAHVERGMQMCTKRRGHFSARCRTCPALFHLHPLFLSHLASSDIPRACSRTRTRCTHTHVHIYIPFFGGGLQEASASRNHADHLLSFPNMQRSVDRSVRRSPDIISLEAPGSEESHVYDV